MNCYRRLPLDGMHNARDLGGYAARDGKMTQYRRMIRADAPIQLSERDVAFLREIGLRYCIDLRSPEECEARKHFFQDDADIRTDNIHFMRSLVTPSGKQPRRTSVDRDLAELYVYLADNAKDAIRDVFQAIANAPEGIVMFNCTAGKDRTGITAALLLAVCGVSYPDIIADYMVTEIYNRAIMEQIKTVAPEVTLTYHKSDPRNIETFFEHIGGVDAAIDFVYGCGVGRGDLHKIQSRLLDA